MRKLIITCIFILFGAVCHATEMCARNDTVVIPLDANIFPVKFGYNTNEKVWWAEFEEGYKIYGVATTLSEAERGKGSGHGSYLNNFGETLLDLQVSAGLSGTDTDGNARNYCWCRMTHPMKSHWVFNSIAKAESCTEFCTHALNRGWSSPNLVKAMLNGLYKSIGNK